MSVIAENSLENLYMYIKGAPEKISSLCISTEDKNFFN